MVLGWSAILIEVLGGVVGGDVGGRRHGSVVPQEQCHQKQGNTQVWHVHGTEMQFDLDSVTCLCGLQERMGDGVDRRERSLEFYFPI